MKTSKYFFSLILFVIFCISTNAQTYVGEVLYRDAFQYVKIRCEEDGCLFSMPYVDNNITYPVNGNPMKDPSWKVQRGIEPWTFTAESRQDAIIGELSLPMGKQKIKLMRQLDPIKEADWTKYQGVYSDDEQRKAIVYAANGYLHLISPYSEESMSLKPIGKDAFWSVSNEQSDFKSLQAGNFQILSITDRSGKVRQLQRSPDIVVESLHIPVGADSLFAKLYIPAGATQAPACLILPGGGAIGIANYEFEARFLAAYGIVCLVFDKSGNGQSRGSGHFMRQTFEDKNDQYKALFRYLQAHPKVDPKRVGVHGPSEGGRLALMMGIDLGSDLAFINAVAAPMMTFREGQFYAMDQHHRILGVDEYDNMAIQQIWQDYYDGILNKEIKTATIAAANLYRQKNDRLFLPPNSSQLPMFPTAADIENKRVLTEAEKIKCPILFQYGENDQRVHRQKSLQNFLPKLKDQSQAMTIIYPRGNHSMMTPEYKICPGYTHDKIKWLQHIGVLQP